MTVLTKIIEKLNDVVKESEKPENSIRYSDTRHTLKVMIDICQQLLSEECEQMERCFEAGQNSIECYGSRVTTNFDTFFTTQFNDK